MLGTTFEPYEGPEKKLVICIDIGTTYSGASYTVLDPGSVPKIRPINQLVFMQSRKFHTLTSVERFPGINNYTGSTRVSTVVCYKPDGSVYKCGAEAENLRREGSDFADLGEDDPRYEELSFSRW